MTTSYLIMFTVAAAVSVALAWRRRAWLLVAGLVVFAYWPVSRLVERIPVWLYFVLALAVVAVGWHRFSRTSATVVR